MEGPVEYHMAQVSEGLGGAVHRADQGGGIPGIFVYFDVDDISDGAQRVRDLGGKAESPARFRRWVGMQGAAIRKATRSAYGRTTRTRPRRSRVLDRAEPGGGSARHNFLSE
jgi:hypothetical protein